MKKLRRAMKRMRLLFVGQSLARILMNEALAHETLHGRVVDVGGGRHPDYFDYLGRTADVQVDVVDGTLSGIDFEKDPLPFGDAYADTILLCNVLEHIYNYQFLMQQVYRVTKQGGHLIGFVPFWVGYHPDPHDYFRYTKESLKRLLAEVGFKDITIVLVGRGPILANFNTLVLSLPRILRPVAYVWYAVFDALFLLMRPNSRARNPLGYQFSAYA